MTEPEQPRRSARYLGFIKARFSPEGYLGLHLTVGLVVVLLAGWWFGEIVENVSRDAATRLLDESVIAWFQDLASPGLTRFAWVITALGSIALVTAGSLVTALVLYKRGFVYRFVAIVVTMGGGSLLNILLKHYFQRQRPVLENPLVTLSSYGFPSGHTMGATLLYGLLALLVAHSSRWAWSHRIFAFCGAALLIALVGVSRIYLGAHYLTDVLGAIALGLAWLAFSWTGIETVRRWRGRKMIP
jgi:membrane-associated phospholipid phosphatase